MHRRYGSSRRIQRSYPTPRTLSRPKLLVIFILILILFAIVSWKQSWVTFFTSEKTKKESAEQQTDILHWRTDFAKLISNYYIPNRWIKGLDNLEEFWQSNRSEHTIQVSFPNNFDVHDLFFDIMAAAEKNRLHMIESYEKITPKVLGMAFSTSRAKICQVIFQEDEELTWYAGKIAVVIDDFGYKNDESVRQFLQLPFAIAFAIIPGTPFSQEIARKAHDAGYDVLIHLPMEPLNSKVENDGYTVLTNMSEKKIDEIVTRAKKSVPFAIGVNNHMGSKATADRTTMTRLMKVLRKHNLIFLDSVTNRKSVAFSVANQTGIPALKLTTYLDNTESSKTVEQKLAATVKALKSAPKAIVIGHDRKETEEVLTREMPRWSFKGVSFVRLNDLLENR